MKIIEIHPYATACGRLAFGVWRDQSPSIRTYDHVYTCISWFEQ